MRLLVCENCGKRYDFQKEDFCPKCGAFNQPVKTWTTDSQGNVRRVDGVNEATHSGSFVHKEVHREKRVRQAVGLDRAPRPKPLPKTKPRPQPQKRDGMIFIKILFWIIGAIVILNFFSLFLSALFW